ncbi:DOMON-like domain-containing protein [Synechococcus sp. CS-1328]|uniref:DOMON-like domain-containing protein n=1 Tax=Synechococcus sp. CS-1328 TaxID=2847976 RepID=UPI00223BE1A6|nr:DOMON-like domain-containing protein [Synechococcus sp. CS-1328]MCT0224156.1 DOMON-like domain-containing protein [Synechococcus sp. CS-1328]
MGTGHQPPPEAQRFTLVPFQSDTATPDLFVAGLSLTGWIQRLGPELRIHYCLQAPLAELLLPPPAQQPQRCDDLWMHTCLEAFLAVEGDDPYWEINLSPSGDWNVYRLEGYRLGLTPEASVTALPFLCQQRPQQLELALPCPLPPPLAAAAALQVGISAVIEHRGGALSTWALAHPGPEADFHRRDGFLLRI